MSIRRRIYAAPAPKMPPGVVELMDGLARDVLKNNPENIYEFCAHHMQKLLEMRDGNAPKPFMTLDQKIAKAQKVVKQRAEQRRNEFDKKFISSSNCNNQDVPTLSKPTCDVSHDSGVPEKEEIKTVEINEIQQKEVKTPVQMSSTPLKTGSTNGNADGVVGNAEIKEGKENDSNTKQETLSLNLIEKEHEANDTEECANTDKNLKHVLSEEQEVNTQDKPSTTDSDRKCADKDNIDDTNEEQSTCNTTTSTGEQHAPNTTTAQEEDLPSNTDTTQGEETTSNTELELNDKTEEKTTFEQNSDIQLQKEDIRSIEQSHIDSQKQTEEALVKNTSDEVSSTNNVIERAVSPPIVATSNNCSEFSAHDTTSTKECEVQNDKSTDNSLNKNTDENETENVAMENHKYNLNEPQNQQDDDEILAVILNEPEYVQSNKLGPVENGSVDPKFKETTDADAENVEIKDDKVINSSMDLETAAVTIQKVFRSFLFKTKTASYDDSTTVDINLLNEDKEKEETDATNIKDRRPLGISRMDTVLQTVNEEKSLSLSTDDSSTFSSAATIIQAHVRGFLVRNKFNSNKTTSTNSLIDSDAPSVPSLESDNDNRKSKTVLNIHIVPESGHFVSRDESVLTSMDLSLDGSPPSSVNLHPLGYDKSERRKQLKREDAIQSVSPPSNNSGKLSDDLDSVKELSVADTNVVSELTNCEGKNVPESTPSIVISEDKLAIDNVESNLDEEIADVASDELDVITPFAPVEGRSSRESVNSSKLLHSGEFHDIVVPTNVTRCDTAVVREFQNVLVYFILWNN